MTIELKDFGSDFDRGASRLTEALWSIFRLLFFRLPIPLPSSLRCTVLRRFGAKIGVGVVIRSGVNISFPWRLSVGDHVWIGEDVMILSLDRVTIGSNCCISQRAFLCTGSHRFDRPGFDLVTKPIVMGDSSWVAAQVFVAPGVTIGPGSMCVAGSVVLDVVPPGMTVIGNPAQVRQRRESSLT